MIRDPFNNAARRREANLARLPGNAASKLQS